MQQRNFLLVSLALFAVIAFLVFTLGLHFEDNIPTAEVVGKANKVEERGGARPPLLPPAIDPESSIKNESGQCYIPQVGEEDTCAEDKQILEKEISDLQEQRVRLAEELAIAHQEIDDMLQLIPKEQHFEWPQRLGRSRTLLVGFPASGVDAIRKYITKITKEPTFSVYTEDATFAEQTGIDLEELNVWSHCWGQDDCNLSETFPIIVKTFFPAVIMQSNLPEFDRVIQIIRNPADTIESFYRMCQEVPWLASRRRSFEYHIKKEVGEYKKFYDYWRRFQADSQIPFLSIRYEDLCENAEHTIREIFKFLDISHFIEEENFQQILAAEHCDSNKIGRVLPEYTEEQIIKMASDLSAIMKRHGYESLMQKFSRYWK